MSPRPVLRHTLSPLRSVTVDPLARVTSPLRYRMGGEPGLFHILSATICREASNERHATDTRVGAAAPQAPPRMRSCVSLRLSVSIHGPQLGHWLLGTFVTCVSPVPSEFMNWSLSAPGRCSMDTNVGPEETSFVP